MGALHLLLAVGSQKSSSRVIIVPQPQLVHRFLQLVAAKDPSESTFMEPVRGGRSYDVTSINMLLSGLKLPDLYYAHQKETITSDRSLMYLSVV